MRGGARKGAGRHPKNKNDKTKYITKTIKFKEEEKFILDYINKTTGKNFSEKLKNILIDIFEKR